MTHVLNSNVITEIQKDTRSDVVYKDIVEPYGFIYITTNLVNGKRYLGQKKFDRKWKEYIGSGRAFKLAVDKYGKENFTRDIVYVCYSADELDAAEYSLSVELNVVESENWYNLVYGGGTTSGLTMTKEMREKLSKIRKESHAEHPEFGERHSQKMIEYYQKHPEAKKNASDKFKQLWQDPEFVDKMSKSRKAYWSDENVKAQRGAITKETWQDQSVREARLSGLKEWLENPENHERRSEISKRNWDKPGYREAQSARNTGDGNPMYGVHRYGIDSPRYIPVYCIELDVIFWGAKEAEKELCIKGSDIAQCCKKKPGHKSAGKHPETGEKLHWLYADDAIQQNYITQQNLNDYLNNLKN